MALINQSGELPEPTPNLRSYPITHLFPPTAGQAQCASFCPRQWQLATTTRSPMSRCGGCSAVGLFQVPCNMRGGQLPMHPNKQPAATAPVLPGSTALACAARCPAPAGRWAAPPGGPSACLQWPPGSLQPPSSQPVSQSVCRSVSQSVSQSVGQSAAEPHTMSYKQPAGAACGPCSYLGSGCASMAIHAQDLAVLAGNQPGSRSAERKVRRM
jgi:hypothetical protein